MRKELATILLLLGGLNLSFGQDVLGPEPCVLPEVPAVADTQPIGFWASKDYLVWWMKNGQLPPLVTQGGNGIIGSPGTQVALEDLGFADHVRQGGRFVLGYQFASNPDIGITGSYFFLGARQDEAAFISTGDPVLGQPYTNATTGLPSATLIAASGSVDISTRSSLQGADANLTACLHCTDTFRLTALGGFRYLRLDDEVTSGQTFRVSPSVPGFGGSSVGVQDDFRTVNNFYGGQVGLEVRLQRSRLMVDLRGKLGLGQMQQITYVNGQTDVLSPTGTMTMFQGGLYALRSNIGRHQRDEVAFIPEVGLNVGMQVTSRVTVFAGYSFLWVSSVARAGDQIDTVVNTTQFPILSGNGPLVGAARPEFGSRGSDFWAQGVSIGLEVRY